jgi:preprotein translocase subunit SecY
VSRTLLTCVLVAILAVQFSTSPMLGFNSSCMNSECSVRAAASFPALIASMVLIAFVLVYTQKSGLRVDAIPVGAAERLAAFSIDFLVVLSAIASILTLPLLLAEAQVTSDFNWSFERDFSRPFDTALAFSSMLIIFAVLFAYFYAPCLSSSDRWAVSLELSRGRGSGRRKKD